MEYKLESSSSLANISLAGNMLVFSLLHICQSQDQERRRNVGNEKRRNLQRLERVSIDGTAIKIFGKLNAEIDHSIPCWSQ